MVSTIEAALLHAEEQSMENPQLKNWLAMYEADTLVMCQQVMGGSKISKKVRLFSSSSDNQLAFRLKMGHKFKALDEIAANRRFHLEERFVGRVSVAQERDQTQSSPPKVVIGRQLEKEAIVKLLLSCDYEENASVVTIFGIGGLGNSKRAGSSLFYFRYQNSWGRQWGAELSSPFLPGCGHVFVDPIAEY